MKTTDNKMTFAVKIDHSLESDVGAYFSIKVSNNNRELINILEQTDADFCELENGCENIIFENFSTYPIPFASNFGKSPLFTAIIECEVSVSRLF